jgi:hypothetical protein
MKEWMGINGYCLKDCILNAAASAQPDLNISQFVAGHVSQANTRRYTR